ncbi:MAG: hydroxymethylbilane synthase [Actinomycetota bacterium]|nr:hydroxymethylbilane synthase [Actinomycetota bacterium]
MIPEANLRTPDHLNIASRGSALALRQASIVADLVTEAYPMIEVRITTVSTPGDRDKARPFAAIGGKGLFTAEVERAVEERRADVAVHSAKDLTAELAPGCVLMGVPARGPVHDVVVGGGHGDGDERLRALPPGARVGTSSMRRRALLAEVRPDLDLVELRGNLDTRLRRVAAGEVDAAVLAAAGLARLYGAAGVMGGHLDPSWWVPAPGQGALAVEGLSDRGDLVALFGSLSDPGTRAELTCERAFSEELEGGCSVPLGCRARTAAGGLTVTGYLGWPGGAQGLRDRISGPPSEAGALGRELAGALLDSGGREILDELEATAEEEVPEIAPP